MICGAFFYINFYIMKKEMIFLKGFVGESLENVIDYWAMMNDKKISGISVVENLKIFESINTIKKELDDCKENREYLSIKELMNKQL